jgi:hypothetical protein
MLLCGLLCEGEKFQKMSRFPMEVEHFCLPWDRTTLVDEH